MQPPLDRLAAAGRQLIEIHEWLREELGRLREGRVPSLTAHCLAFCAAVTRHHTAEDTGAFTQLAAHYPALRPVIDELTRDHEIVAGLLRRVEELARGTGEADEIQRELDGLAALLESHFTYEERKLTAALTELEVTPALW
jgi:hemerythrin-like domain-containing protein